MRNERRGGYTGAAAGQRFGEGNEFEKSQLMPGVSALHFICRKYALEPGLSRLVMFLQVYEQALQGRNVYMSDLAEMMDMPLSTLSKQLGRLARPNAREATAAGSLLIQSNDPLDRRRVCLGITLFGAELLKKTGDVARMTADNEAF